jgi:beta-glucosidase
MIRDYEERGYFGNQGWAAPEPGDDKIIATPIDFLGINYYNRAVLRSDAIPEEENAPREVFVAPESEWTEMAWEVYPDGLRQLLIRVRDDYGPRKIFITENGASYSDGPGEDGRIADQRRIDFLKSHFESALAAIAAGVPLAGYFVWSLLDNFEWERGYGQRFGIVWVDYRTLERRLKDSALWYRGVIQKNGI